MLLMNQQILLKLSEHYVVSSPHTPTKTNEGKKLLLGKEEFLCQFDSMRQRKDGEVNCLKRHVMAD